MNGLIHDSLTVGSHETSQGETGHLLRPGGFAARAILIAALGAVLRFLLIDRYPLSLDEAYCFEMAKKAPGSLIAALSLGNEPPLHLLVLHYWMRGFGESPLALRSLSVVASVLTLGVIAFWRASWFSQRARLLAAFVLAITPISIYYGQVVRMYSLVVLFITLLMVFLERGLRKGGIRNWGLFSLFTALSLYTSYIAIYVVPVGYLAIGAMYLSRRYAGALRPRLTALLAAHLAAAAMFLPWLGVFRQQPTSTAVQWIRFYWAPANKASLPLRSLSLMTTGGAHYPEYLYYLYQGPKRTQETRQAIREGKETNPLLAAVTAVHPIVPLAASTALAALVFWMALSKGNAFPFRAFLGAWLLLSFGAPILLSFIRPIFMAGRYELPGVVAFAALTGIGLARMPAKLRAACAAVMIVLFLYTWTYMLCWPTQASRPQRGALLARIASPGDVVLCEGFEYSPMYYYVGPAREKIIFITVPRDTIDHSAWLDFEKWFAPPKYAAATPALEKEASAAIDEAIRRIPAGRALVLVPALKPCGWEAALDDAVSAPIDRAVSAGVLRPDAHASQTDWRIFVFRKSAPAAP